MEQDHGASVPDRAVVNGAASVSAVPASVPSAVKAYAVTENMENTGGILFAKHAVVARRLGADEWGDGEFSYVSCRRAKWADRYADTGIVPASACIQAGWHFECSYCGSRIDWDHRPYKSWAPTSVIGSQHSAVYCDRSCEGSQTKRDEYAERLKKRVLSHYKYRLLKRLPGISVRWLDQSFGGSHVYITHDGRIDQVFVNFDWPGQAHGPASFRWQKRGSHAQGITCCFGDKEAFEQFAAQAIEARRAETERLGAKPESAVHAPKGDQP